MVPGRDPQTVLLRLYIYFEVMKFPFPNLTWSEELFKNNFLFGTNKVTLKAKAYHFFGGIHLYDPTVFDNLKVAFENQVYDLDTIEREIRIIDRSDMMDFAVLARKFAVQFTLFELENVSAEIILEASLRDLAEEILETPGGNPGCSLTLRFQKHVHHEREQCSMIEESLSDIWENEVLVTQTLSFLYGEEVVGYLNTIEVKFRTKINEENMGEIPDFLHSVLMALRVLHAI